MLIRFISQSMSSQRSDNVSEGVLGHRTSENLPTQNPSDWFWKPSISWFYNSANPNTPYGAAVFVKH
jgi:hypothetical protein